MTSQQDKQIKVPFEVHQEIKLLSANEGREMREIVTTAVEFYMKYRNEDIVINMKTTQKHYGLTEDELLTPDEKGHTKEERLLLKEGYITKFFEDEEEYEKN